jgi:hypothetical protein
LSAIGQPFQFHAAGCFACSDLKIQRLAKLQCAQMIAAALEGICPQLLALRFLMPLADGLRWQSAIQRSDAGVAEQAAEARRVRNVPMPFRQVLIQLVAEPQWQQQQRRRADVIEIKTQ